MVDNRVGQIVTKIELFYFLAYRTGKLLTLSLFCQSYYLDRNVFITKKTKTTRQNILLNEPSSSKQRLVYSILYKKFDPYFRFLIFVVGNVFS